MKERSLSEHILIEEVTQACRQLQLAARGCHVGSLIRSIRIQLGMSQKALAERAKVPQSTVSRIEQGQKDTSLSSLSKISRALSCDLVIAPLLKESIESIRLKQARKKAEKQIRYLKGTMNLEDQQPDSQFIEKLLKQEEQRFLQGPSSKLWNEHD